MNKKMLIRAMTMLSVSALALVAWAGQDQISLMRKLKPGDAAEYAITAAFDGPTGPIKYTGTLSQKVTNVQPDGTYSIDETTTDQNVDYDGGNMSPPDSKVLTTYSPTGRVISIVSEQDDVTAEAYRVVHLQTFETPKDPVKIGDEIKYTIPADTKLGTPGVSADYKVVGLEKVKDWNTVKLTYKSEETEGDLKASMAGTVWMDASDGTLVKVDGTWANVQRQGAPFPLTGKYGVIRTK